MAIQQIRIGLPIGTADTPAKLVELPPAPAGFASSTTIVFTLGMSRPLSMMVVHTSTSKSCA